MVFFSRFLASLPMTSGQMRFLPAVEMTDVSREKRGRCGGEAAAPPTCHQWHGVISTAGRNLVIMNYLILLWRSRNDGEAKEKKAFSGGFAAAKCPSFSNAACHSERSEESFETFTGK